MAELPKFVQQSMAQHRYADPAGHPDANLLAAFAGHALVEREREAVLAHLAQCPDCRELLALATAAQPEPVAAVRVTVADKRSWFAEWRWVGAAVACCIVAAALQVRLQPPAVEQPRYTSVPPASSMPATDRSSA